VELIGPYLAACLLLAVAGVGKAMRPADTARAVAAVMPMPLGAIRTLVRTGAVVLARGGPLASCGCFGRPDTPATRLHVIVNIALAASSAAVAATVNPGWLPTILAAQPWHGVPLVLLSLLCAWLSFLVLSRLAELGAVRRMLGVTRGTGA
jgi:uncharacterized protein YjeT (DUF2065 family)